MPSFFVAYSAIELHIPPKSLPILPELSRFFPLLFMPLIMLTACCMSRTRRWVFVHEGTQFFKCIRRTHHLLLYFLPRKAFSALETSLQPTHQNVVTQSQAQSRNHFQARHIRIVYIEVTLGDRM